MIPLDPHPGKLRPSNHRTIDLNSKKSQQKVKLLKKNTEMSILVHILVRFDVTGSSSKICFFWCFGLKLQIWDP